MSPAAPTTTPSAVGQDGAFFSPGVLGQSVLLLALAAALGTVPLLQPSSHLLQLLTLALIFSIPAVGLSLLYGEGGQMSVANGALYGVGAYVAAMLARAEIAFFWPGLVLGALGGAVAATVVGLTALRVRGHYFLIITFGFAELFRIALVNLRSLTGGNQGLLVLEDVRLPFYGPVETLPPFYLLTLALAVLCAFAVIGIRFSPFGRDLRALRENERLAVSLGLNAVRARLLAFAFSGAIAGLAGTIYAYHVKHIGPDLFGAHAGIQIVLVLLIGGPRSPVGPIVGSILLFLAPEVIRLDPVSTQIVYGAVLIGIVLCSPQGLAPGIAGLPARLLGAGSGRRGRANPPVRP